MADILRWPDLIAHLEERYQEVETFPGDLLRFTFDHADGAVPIGGQVVRAPSGMPWLILAIKLVPTDRLRTRSALVANADLPVGGLAIVREFGVIRQSLPLEGLRPAELQRTLEALATVAAQLKHVSELEDADIDTPYAYVFR